MGKYPSRSRESNSHLGQSIQGRRPENPSDGLHADHKTQPQPVVLAEEQEEIARAEGERLETKGNREPNQVVAFGYYGSTVKSKSFIISNIVCPQDSQHRR